MRELIHSIAGTIWGMPLAVMIASLGMFLTFKSGFFQIVRFPQIIKNTFGRLFDRGKGAGEAFRAMCVALGGTIGVGNIAGVSTAIITGGAGAIFWMWVSGFLGMIVKFYEVALAVKFRDFSKGELCGGPMYYMQKSGFRLLRVFAYIFAVFCVLASLTMGGITQSATIAESAELSFGIPAKITAAVLLIALLPVVTGKTTKIQRFSGIFVPLMSAVYILCCLIIIFSRPTRSAAAFVGIFKTAFDFKAASAGVGGFCMSRAISAGLSRGLFTNEAGLGSAPIAHASNPDASPLTQGMWGVVEVFIDTIVICTLTALAVLGSGVINEKNVTGGLELSCKGFDEVFGQGIGQSVIAVCIFMFAYASIVAWGFYGKSALTFINDNKTLKIIYLIVFVSASAAGTFLDTGLCFEISDIVNAPLLTVNIIAVCLLYPTVIKDREIKNFMNNNKNQSPVKFQRSR